MRAQKDEDVPRIPKEFRNYYSLVDRREPNPHPLNCTAECAYGYGRAFCFPCIAKLKGKEIATGG